MTPAKRGSSLAPLLLLLLAGAAPSPPAASPPCEGTPASANCRAAAIAQIATRLAQSVRDGTYDSGAIDARSWSLPYPEDAQREAERAAAVELETGPTVPGSFVYCRTVNILATHMLFAGAPDPHGDLRFGFVSTGAFDRNLVLFGTAQLTRGGWRYRRAREESIDHRCDVRISPVGKTDCQAPTADGLTTPGVEPTEFTSEDLQGRVTWQLSSEPAFDALATECPR